MNAFDWWLTALKNSTKDRKETDGQNGAWVSPPQRLTHEKGPECLRVTLLLPQWEEWLLSFFLAQFSLQRCDKEKWTFWGICISKDLHIYIENNINLSDWGELYLTWSLSREVYEPVRHGAFRMLSSAHFNLVPKYLYHPKGKPGTDEPLPPAGSSFQPRSSCFCGLAYSGSVWCFQAGILSNPLHWYISAVFLFCA